VTHSDAENEQGDRMMRCEKVAQNVGRRLFSKLKKKKKTFAVKKTAEFFGWLSGF
jgi:hypothetical protein